MQEATGTQVDNDTAPPKPLSPTAVQEELAELQDGHQDVGTADTHSATHAVRAGC